jgi:parvulin-like peptidyl-prolyl isomerase
MKTIIFFFVFISGLSASAQQTPTPKQAREFLEANINPIVDINENDKAYALLKDRKPGEIVVDGKDIYKIVGTTTMTSYNAGYIFLDTNKLPEDKIKQLTDDILSQYSSGMTFEELIKRYSMDNNPNAAQLKFTEGQMVASFEKAVKEHATGEVFTVVTPEKGWFHIVKKNEDNRTIKAISAEYAVYKAQ